VRAWLAGEGLVPRRNLLVEREDLPSIAREALRHLRVERVPGALADKLRSALNTSQQALEGGVHGDVDDAHRQWDLLALRTTERALAVPTLQ
jgi:hypothetical protein